MLNPTKRRFQRSFFDGVGSMSKALFGTMDQADADTIYARLGELETDTTKAFDLIKEHSVVVASNYDHMRNTIAKMEEQNNRTLNRLELATAGQGETIRRMLETEKWVQLQMALDEAMARITFQLQEVLRQQALTISIVTAVQGGQLHPLILSFDQITDLMNASAAHHQVEGRFISPWSIRQLAEVQGMQMGDKLIVKITIPLPVHTNYTLNRAYHLPIPLHGNIYGLYAFEADYIAVDHSSDRYAMLTNEDISSCKKLTFDLRTTTYICSLPTLFSSTEGNCVVSLFNHSSRTRDYCQRSEIYLSHDLLVRLPGKNSWLYSLTQKRDMHVRCPQYMAETQLQGSGVLGIEPHCEVQVEQQLLIATARGEGQIDPIIVKAPVIDWEIPKLPFSIEGPSNKSIKVFQHRSFAKELERGGDEMKNFQRELEKAEKEREVRRMRNLQVSHYASLGGMSFLLVVSASLIGIVIWTVRKIRSQKRTRPTVSGPVISIPTISELVVSRPTINRPIPPPPIADYLPVLSPVRTRTSQQPTPPKHHSPKATSNHCCKEPITLEHVTRLSALNVRVD